MARGRRKWRRGLAIGAAAAAAMTAGAASPLAAQIFTDVEFDGVRMSVTPREVKALQELGYALAGPPGAQDKALAEALLAAGKDDPGEINTRLGMALLQAGRRSEAEAAFREAAKAPRYADLAQFWLLWLVQPR